MKPILIVTCRAGSEDWCEEEIGNILFPHDPDIKIEKTRYPGLLIIYSDKIDPIKAYTYAYAFEYGFVEKIIPIYVYEKFTLENISLLERLIGFNERIKVKLRIRGKRGLSTIVWRRIMDVLKSKSSIHDPKSNICLFVEVIDEYMYAGKVKC